MSPLRKKQNSTKIADDKRTPTILKCASRIYASMEIIHNVHVQCCLINFTLALKVMSETSKSWTTIILILISEYRNYLIPSKDEELRVKKEEAVVFRPGGVLES